MSEPTRLLFADDDESIRFIVKDHLAQEGFAVDLAADGDEAVRMVDQNTYEMVLLDINMPGKSGLDVLRHMKERNIRPRVIMLTAIDEISIAIQAVKLGANDYITKPFSVETLLGGIQRILAK